MKYSAATHVGLMRSTNEDSHCVFDLPSWPAMLLAVADGMGGCEAGEVASALALQSVREFLERQQPPADPGGWGEVLRLAIRFTNRRVYGEASTAPGYRGMGTTLTVALCGRDRAYTGHVGDSRAYLIRRDSIAQLTEDHSLVAQLVRSGRLSEDEARYHPQRNVLTYALGTEAETRIDIQAHSLLPGDILLLCTDGLTSLVTDPEILGVVSSEGDLDRAAWRLVDLALERGGLDNITVLLAQAPGMDGGGRP